MVYNDEMPMVHKVYSGYEQTQEMAEIRAAEEILHNFSLVCCFDLSRYMNMREKYKYNTELNDAMKVRLLWKFKRINDKLYEDGAHSFNQQFLYFIGEGNRVEWNPSRNNDS